jgi:hypothetical protein
MYEGGGCGAEACGVQVGGELLFCLLFVYDCIECMAGWYVDVPHSICGAISCSCCDDVGLVFDRDCVLREVGRVAGIIIKDLSKGEEVS